MKKVRNKKGMGTVEIVIIIAVLVTLALIFRESLISYGKKVMDYCFDDNKVIGSL
ncbi:MAG: hypothetical protein K6G47_09185 [Clostridia bacterium]|nr:hypothetical protein [Clostridia bacterium]